METAPRTSDEATNEVSSPVSSEVPPQPLSANGAELDQPIAVNPQHDVEAAREERRRAFEGSRLAELGIVYKQFG